MTSRGALLERFFRYVAIESQSDARSDQLPSSPGQSKLAALLAEELRELGIAEVALDEQAIVTGIKRGRKRDAPKIGFIAHLDTVDVGLSPNIRPQVLHFTGADLCLNGDRDIWLRVADHPEIRPWTGHDIVFSDGTSVLGADNKAAISVIMTLLSQLEGKEGSHGDIHVAFVPDEEIGLRGAQALDLKRFACDFAYTIDCCQLGELMLENFNAAAGEIIFRGVSAHPMSAKGILINPLLMALDFVAEFDRRDTPEYSQDREGFFWFKELRANDSEARLNMIIRDFDDQAFERRKEKIEVMADVLRARYPRGQVEARVTDTYRNIASVLKDDPRSEALLLRAFELAGVKPKPISMRGGTDGAALSARGIPTPNFFTGALNFHSRFEFLPLAAFEKSLEVAMGICALAAKPTPEGNQNQ